MVSARKREAHAKMAVNAREERRARERAAAKARIPEGIAALLADAARADRCGYNFGAYYELGYRLGITHLSEASRNRLIGTLVRRRRELRYTGHLWNWQGRAVAATLAEMARAPVERLALDVAKLTRWDDRRASTSLHAILKDPAVVIAIPRSRHHQFLGWLARGRCWRSDALSSAQISISIIKRWLILIESQGGRAFFQSDTRYGCNWLSPGNRARSTASQESSVHRGTLYSISTRTVTLLPILRRRPRTARVRL